MLNKFKAAGISSKLLYAALTVYSLAFIGFSFFLRPVGDSYVYAQANAMFYGPAGATAVWWENYSPMVVKEFMAFLFVGLPLLYLPWWLSSSIAFMVNGLLITGAVVNLGLFKKFKSNKFLVFSIVNILVNVLWLTYWFVYGIVYNPEKVSFITTKVESSKAHLGMFYEAMDYQIGVMSYVGVTCLMFIMLALVNKYKGLNSWRGYILVLVAGIVTSTASFTLSGAVLCLLALMIASYRLWRFRISGFNFNFTHLLVLLFSVMATTLLALISPGFKARNAATAPLTPMSADDMIWSGNNYMAKDFVDIIGYTLTHTLMDLRFMLLNFGSILFIFAALGAGFILNKQNVIFNRRNLLFVGIVSLAGGFLSNFVIAYSHLKVYTASWHQMQSGLFYFIGLLCLGMWISGVDFKRMSWVRPVSAITALALTAGALFSYSQHAVEREVYWNKGDVSSAFSPDLSNEWGIYAWDTVLEYRGEEDFRNIREVYVPDLDSSMYGFVWRLK